MKKFFIATFFILTLFVSSSASAQADSCYSVDQSNYAECCLDFTKDYTLQCEDYRRGAEGDTTGIGTINGGAQNTGTTFNSPFSGAADNNNVSFVSQSSSPVLQECSAIKFKSLLDILIWAKCVITAVLIPMIFTLAFLFFLWNVLVFIRSNDKTNKEEAKQRMGWGILALFIMLGVWGIIAILSNTLGINPSVPLLQTEYLDPKNASK